MKLREEQCAECFPFAQLRNPNETLFNETGTSGGSAFIITRGPCALPARQVNAHSRLWIWAFAFRPITQAATRVDEA